MSISEEITDLRKKVGSYVGVPLSEDDEPTLMDEMGSLFPSLSLTQRWYGFGICFVLGWFISFLSVISVGSIVTDPARFAFPYTIGSLVSICSSFFIWGPWKQCKKMFELHRLLATSMYLIAMALTLYLAFTQTSPILILLSILVKFLAMCWYVLSWIPYGRRMALKMLGGLLSC